MTRTTTTTTATLAVAADYADALMTARRAKNWLFLLLLLILLTQITVFFLVKFNVLHLNDTVAVSSSSTSSSTTDTASTQSAGLVTVHYTKVGEVLRYIIPWFDFLGIIFAVTLSVVLLLLAGIMLVGRLIGVSHVTAAFIWSVVLALILFPWQAFLISGEHYYTTTPGTSGYATSAEFPDQPAFKLPGVLYTYPELYQDAHFPNQPLQQAIIKWFRFAAFPIVALLLLLLVQGGSSRGLKFALGESEMHVDVGNRANEPVV